MADNREEQIKNRREAVLNRRAAGDYKKVPAGPPSGVTKYPKKNPTAEARNLGSNTLTLSFKRSPYASNPELYRGARFFPDYMLFGTPAYVDYYLFEYFGITDNAKRAEAMANSIGEEDLVNPNPNLVAFIESSGKERQVYLVSEKAQDEKEDKLNALLYDLTPFFAELIRPSKNTGAPKKSRGLSLQQKLDNLGSEFLGYNVSALGKPGKTPGVPAKYNGDPAKALKMARIGNTRLYSSNERGARLALQELNYSPDAIESLIAQWRANQGNLAPAAAAAAAPLGFTPSSVSSPPQTVTYRPT
jgi:hypothetical protein